ncbi:MAG: tellurite resistance TerB family protein [Rhodocyclaceae bacterium]|nr:tellurite resistance TerB family protein [Rhodocyclaceae bacterium]
MNLLGTLAKVAVGVMLARGAGRMMRGGGSTGGGSTDGDSAGGGLGDLMGGLTRGGGAGDLLGGLLGGLAGGRGQSGGGLGDLLGGVLSGGGAAGGAGELGGLGGLLESLGGARSGGGGLGQMFNRAMAGETTPTPSAEVNQEAALLIRAMINAAKSDGSVDAEEQGLILEQLGEVGSEELEFVRQELARPLDEQDFLRSIPRGLAPQVYLMSLLAIKLDSNAEVGYLDRLARATGLTPETVNGIHARVGVPALYT